MARWAVSVSQYSKESGNFLTSLEFTVEGANKDEAKAAALNEVVYWSSKYQPIHQDDDRRIRTKLKLGWINARNVITSIKRLKD